MSPAPELVPPDPAIQERCDNCGGSGYVIYVNEGGHQERDPETGAYIEERCDQCDGQGWYEVQA